MDPTMMMMFLVSLGKPGVTTSTFSIFPGSSPAITQLLLSREKNQLNIAQDCPGDPLQLCGSFRSWFIKPRYTMHEIQIFISRKFGPVPFYRMAERPLEGVA